MRRNVCTSQALQVRVVSIFFFFFFIVKVTDLKKEEMHGQKRRSEAGTGKSAQVLIWKSYKQKSITLLHPGSKPMHAARAHKSENGAGQSTQSFMKGEISKNRKQIKWGGSPKTRVVLLQGFRCIQSLVKSANMIFVRKLKPGCDANHFPPCESFSFMPFSGLD